MKKFIALVVAFCLIPICGITSFANEIGQTQVYDCAVFIDEQPVFTYLYEDTNYIPVVSLDKYGFDVLVEGNTLTLKRNKDKNIEFASKSLINRKKDDELFKKTYPVLQGTKTVLLESKPIMSLTIEGQECIATSSLSNYAAISWDKDKRIEKLDYKKKEFEIKQKEIISKTIDYTDAESAGYPYRVMRVLLGRYTGEVSENMRNGFGVLEFNYIDNGNNGKTDSITNGYWKNNLRNGFHIYEEWEEKNTWGWFHDFDKNYTGGRDHAQQYCMMRANYKDDKISDGAFLDVYIRYDSLNKDSSQRQEGMYYDGGYDGLYRVSKIDDSYKYGYRVVSETMWDKGDIALTKEEILAKFDEIQPPLSEDEIKQLDAKINSDLPGSLEECYIALEKVLEPEDIEQLKTGEDMWQYHFGLGMWIRNSWLWGGQSGVYKYFVLNGVTHPDNMSGIIIEGFYHYLNGMDFDIEEIFYQNKKGTVISYLTNISLEESEEENGEQEWANPFADVKESDWFYADVEYVVANGLFNGTSATIFDPGAPMTRVMFVTVLARSAGVDTSGGNFWYSQAIEWGIENEITDGLALSNNITREQMMTQLYRYSGSPFVTGDLSFIDAEYISDYALSAIIWAVEIGIIKGYPNGTINPQGVPTRAEVPAMLHRFMEAVEEN